MKQRFTWEVLLASPLPTGLGPSYPAKVLQITISICLNCDQVIGVVVGWRAGEWRNCWGGFDVSALNGPGNPSPAPPTPDRWWGLGSSRCQHTLTCTFAELCFDNVSLKFISSSPCLVDSGSFFRRILNRIEFLKEF